MWLVILCRFFSFWCVREEGVEIICLLFCDQLSCSLEFLVILIFPTIHAGPPYYIVLEFLRLFLPVRTHVYFAICDLQTLIADFNFLLINVFFVPYLYIPTGLSYIFIVTYDASYTVYSTGNIQYTMNI